jgi:hypothetical protein
MKQIYGMLHNCSQNSTLQNTMLHYLKKRYNTQNSIKLVDKEEKSTDPWFSWTCGLTYPNPVYGQSQSIELHQPIDWLGIKSNLTSP